MQLEYIKKRFQRRCLFEFSKLNYLLYITNTDTQQRIKNVSGQVDESRMARTMWKNMQAADNRIVYGIRFFGLPPNVTRILKIFIKTFVPWPIEPTMNVKFLRYVAF